MSVTLDDLKELDQFDKFKSYIKNFILADQSQTLLKLIYYSNTSPLTQPDLENPYDLFTESNNGEHGVVLFKRKNSAILNSSSVIVLVDFELTNKSKEFDTVYIIIRIIIKDISIDELDNGISRSFAIAKLIDDEFNMAKVNGLGEITKVSFEELSMSDENIGYTLLFKGFAFNSDWSTNKNFKKRIMHQ